MLKKIISIKNVGRFLNSAVSPNPPLAKHTVIVGANGYGKTTICAILRSLQSGVAFHVLGRKTLGVTDPQTVELLLAAGTARFDGSSWSAAHPSITIFDGVFVAENVHSGDVVEIDQKRSLYRVIIGDAGLKLAEADAALAAASRTKTGEIALVAKGLQSHIPTGMKLDAFIDLPAVADIDAQIEEQKRNVEAVQEASAMRDRAALSELALPVLPEAFTTLVVRTIDDIAQDAERLLSEHLSRHGMQANGGNWIANGIDYAQTTCPFCGRGIEGLALVAAFRAVFSERYKALGADIAAMKILISQLFGEAVLVRLEMMVEQNKVAAEYWAKYCTFDSSSFALPIEFASAIRDMRDAALVLLDRKTSAPFAAVAFDEQFTHALEAYDSTASQVESGNIAIRAINTLIAEKKAAIGTVDIRTAEAELVRRQTVKTRHSVSVAPLCADYRDLVAKKEGIDNEKEKLREKLDAHTKTVVKPYERRINHYLMAFNTGFGITEIKHAYPGGVATSSYQLVINDTAVDVGDGKTPPDRPSFQNTLSAGDRTTLALAFFLAHLERDPAIADKIVVFDDPLNSQDAFRRRQTVHEIMKVARKCAQVIVLSHDATFVKQVWEKSPPAERVALTIADHRSQGSKLTLIDLEKACQGRTASDLDDLQTYVTTGAGALIDIIRKMRVVLETHCRTTYPGCFLPSDWLGDMVRKIREGGDTHLAQDLYDELDQINGYTSQYHHGEDLGDSTPDQIDPTELTGFARRTLRTVNALQA